MIEETDGEHLSMLEFSDTLEKYTPPDTELKAFFVYTIPDFEESPALLIFAKTAVRARVIARAYAERVRLGLESKECFEYYFKIYTRVKLGCLMIHSIYEAYIFKYADSEKLKKNIPHIGTPVHCEGCNIWGKELNRRGYCVDCYYGL